MTTCTEIEAQPHAANNVRRRVRVDHEGELFDVLLGASPASPSRQVAWVVNQDDVEVANARFSCMSKLMHKPSKAEIETEGARVAAEYLKARV